MQGFLYEYHPLDATTWVYLSSLIIIAVYFKFRRFWSVRNLDLIGLILLAPGLLLVLHGWQMNAPAAGAEASMDKRSSSPLGDQAQKPNDGKAGTLYSRSAEDKPGRPFEQRGYLWLMVVGGFFLFRMLVDSAMVRRPLLEPNLSASGLSFTCVAMLVFLMSNVVNPPPAETDGGARANAGERVRVQEEHADTPEIILKKRGPGYPAFHVFSAESDDATKRATAIVAHLAVVLGMVLIGYRHFDNIHTGIAAATLYLLLPYTANFTNYNAHVVPGALLVWAIQTYRRPVLAGILVGLAAGLIWYPLFLLPLWCSFYWRRGLLRFSLAVLVVLGLVAVSLLFTPHGLGPHGLGSYTDQFCQTFGLRHVRTRDLDGFWEGSLASFRYSVLAAFVAMCLSMVFWPAQKNLGSLLACSAAIMLGTQFWKAYEGGTFMAWYLPLLILTIFRPNLEDRVALSAISEGWVKWRK